MYNTLQLVWFGGVNCDEHTRIQFSKNVFLRAVYGNPRISYIYTSTNITKDLFRSYIMKFFKNSNIFFCFFRDFHILIIYTLQKTSVRDIRFVFVPICIYLINNTGTYT